MRNFFSILLSINPALIQEWKTVATQAGVENPLQP